MIGSHLGSVVFGWTASHGWDRVGCVRGCSNRWMRRVVDVQGSWCFLCIYDFRPMYGSLGSFVLAVCAHVQEQLIPLQIRLDRLTRTILCELRFAKHPDAYPKTLIHHSSIAQQSC